jgi:hypothetical protein
MVKKKREASEFLYDLESEEEIEFDDENSKKRSGQFTSNDEPPKKKSGKEEDTSIKSKYEFFKSFFDKYSNYLVEKGKLELVGNWLMISDLDKSKYFRKFQEFSKTDGYTINLTMQSSDPIYRRKKMEEFEICWQKNKDKLADLFKYPGAEKLRIEKIVESRNKIDQFDLKNFQTFKNEKIPQEHLEEPEFSTIEKVFEENEFDTFSTQFSQQESQIKIQLERIERLERMVYNKDNKIEELTKSVNKLIKENKELNTTVYMNEVACEDSQHLLESKPNQDEQSFWKYIDDYFPNIEVVDLLHWFSDIRVDLQMGNSKSFLERLEKNKQLDLKLKNLSQNLRETEISMNKFSEKLEEKRIKKIEEEKKRKESEKIESAKKWIIEEE